MDQPAGLQVDYVFRGVEHAVRVSVSGQVLELEVEDRMTADQWRGEFDASCECACPGVLPTSPFCLTRTVLRLGGRVGLIPQARGAGVRESREVRVHGPWMG